MTAPGVNKHGRSLDSGEFNPGQGIVPNPKRGYTPTNLDEHRAIMQTDPANPGADHMAALAPNPNQGSVDILGVVTMGDLKPEATPLVREGAALPSSGQHKKIDPSKARGGDPEHFPDGLQDGSGEAWRAAQPPNPVVDGGPNAPVISGP